MMLLAGTLPFAPGFCAWMGVTRGLPGNTSGSACVTNGTPFFVETMVPVGMIIGVAPVLVKTTLPVAAFVPTVVLPVACPRPVTVVSKTSV